MGDGGFSGLTGYALHPIAGSSMCANQDRAIFWDNVHPTSRAHCYIAYAWHLAIHEQTGKWPEPDVQGFNRMCGATQAWHGTIPSYTFVRSCRINAGTLA